MQRLSKGYDWVIYTDEHWDKHCIYPLVIELAQQLGKARIFCVERPMCLITGPLRKRALFFHWLKYRNKIRTPQKNLLLFRPFVLLHDHLAAKIPIIQAVNIRLLSRQLRSAIQRTGLRMGRLIVLIYDPFDLEYLGLVEEQLSIYHRYDEPTVWPESPFFRTREQVRTRDKSILRKVDIVFAVSQASKELIKDLHSNIHVMPMAVDMRLFNFKNKESTQAEEDISGIPKPIIGYVGRITDRIDFHLLEQLADIRPDWSFVLVEVSSQVKVHKIIKNRPNIYYLGGKSHIELPYYLNIFDVCIIPYLRMHPQNVYCSPLKLYTYLTTGKPIVTTDLLGVHPFSDLVRIAHDVAEFEHEISMALAEGDECLERRRIEAARENSWEKQAEKILAIVKKTLRRKYGKID